MSIDPRTPWQEAGIHGLARARDWDAIVTVHADVPGDAVEFATLPDGTLVAADSGGGGLEPLAAAVASALPPPYRAQAVRRGPTLWAVRARTIEVIELPEGPSGETIELTRTAEGTTLTVEDVRSFGSLPALEALGAREGREYAVHAERLAGSFWEVRASAL